ncbi:MAG: hypothetical protein HYX20_00095 [Candidatus Yanofskybacteria bacterium]|nr:hypothetical protein [Candidatus Yanofskybacteria bacterium]
MNTAIIAIFGVVSTLLVIGVLSARQYQLTNSDTHLRRHRISMRSVFSFVVTGVLILEIAIRLGLIQSGEHKYFWVHLVFAIPFFVLTAVLVFWKNGIRSPYLHKKLGYLCSMTFIGTLITGLIFLLT